MKRYLGLLLCGLLLAPPVLAAKPAEKAAEPDARTEVLSGEFDQFVRQAIDEGLLAPSSSGERVGAPAEAPAAEAEHPVAAPVAPIAVAMDCSKPYPLDFTEFESVATYADILNYRSQMLQAGGVPEDDPRLAKAYIALDLGSEAVMNLRNPDNQEEIVLREIAFMLDGRMRTNLTYFQELAGCYERANFWLGVAQLTEGQGEGASRIDASFNEFRHLPLQLRTSVTAIAVPALDATGGRFLAQKMMASFSKEELADSSQLQFANAVIELAQGNMAAEELIRTYLLQGRFQEDALFTLIRHKRMIDASLRSILLNGMLVKIEQSQRDEDIRAGLKFVLEELGSESRYITMMDMASRENMQSEAAQSEIRNNFVASLQRDLVSEDPLHNLAAIEALSVETGLLDHHPDRTGLYEAATLKAVRLGFASLADELSRKTQPGEGVAEQRAKLAYRLNDYGGVFQSADANPANPQIGLIAALSAIDQADTAQLQKYVSRLTPDEDTVLALIEHDAATGRWIVPEQIYQAAGALTDEAAKARVARVMALKGKAGSAETSPEPVNMAGVSERLMSTRVALEALEAEDP